jgi:hypothetical protein
MGEEDENILSTWEVLNTAQRRSTGPLAFPLILPIMWINPVNSETVRVHVDRHASHATEFVKALQLSSYQGKKGLVPLDLLPGPGDPATKRRFNDERRERWLSYVLKGCNLPADQASLVYANPNWSWKCSCSLLSEHHPAC